MKRALRSLIGGGDANKLAAAPRLLEACDAARDRAVRSLEWSNANNGSQLDTGLDHLTLARAALCQAILRGQPPVGDHMGEAMGFLRRAADQVYFPRGLLTRALFRSMTADFDGAREDLDEAFEIAERGPMKLQLADIHLHRARLFGLMANRPERYPWGSPHDDLDKARKLIDECGYGRRSEELEDAEAAWQRLYGCSEPHASI